MNMMNMFFGGSLWICFVKKEDWILWIWDLWTFRLSGPLYKNRLTYVQWLLKWFPFSGGIGGIVHPPIGSKNTTYGIPLIDCLRGVICYWSHLLREPETTIDMLVVWLLVSILLPLQLIGEKRLEKKISPAISGKPRWMKHDNPLPGDSKWPFYPLVGGHLTI